MYKNENNFEFDRNKKYYFCFSWRVKEFLKERNFRYETKDKHKKTGNIFYLYEWNDKLDSTLQEYSKLKKKAKNKILINKIIKKVFK